MHFLHQYMTVLNWIQLVLATPVVWWCGWPFFERAAASLLHRRPNMFTLIALGVGQRISTVCWLRSIPHYFRLDFTLHLEL